MSGQPSAAAVKARAAYEKNPSAWTARTLAKKYGVAPSTIYRAAWFKKPVTVVP